MVGSIGVSRIFRHPFSPFNLMLKEYHKITVGSFYFLDKYLKFSLSL